MRYYINGILANENDLQRLADEIKKGANFTLVKEDNNFYFILKI